MKVTLDSLIKKLDQTFEIKVGFPKSKPVVYPPDNRKGRSDRGGQTVASVANKQEFGHKRAYWRELLKVSKSPYIDIPSRPFLRRTMKKKKQQILELMKNYYRLQNIGDKSYLESVGQQIRDWVKETMVTENWVPNSPRTVAIKKSSKPLIDRGIMKKSVTYEVIKK